MTARRSRARGRAPRHLQARPTTICSTSARSASAARRCPRSARSRGSPSPRGTRGEPHAWAITVDGGAKSAVKPGRARRRHPRRGARPVLRHAGAAEVPQERPQPRARRSREVVRRLAMSRPDVAFTLAGEERAPVTWAAALPGAPGRLAAARPTSSAREFRANAVEVDGEREGVAVEGFAGAADLHPRQRRSGSICSSTAGRCATSC